MAMEQTLSADVRPMSANVRLPKKVVVAGFISTFIEWYDFLVYGTVAALVFNQLPARWPRSRPLRSVSLPALSVASSSDILATALVASRC